MAPTPATLVVATDLDGCLLDETTYSHEPARPALAALRERRAVLVLCSSKTRAEMEALAQEMGCGCPLVVENGGALVVPDGGPSLPVPPGGRGDGGWTLALGVPREALVRALAEIADETGAGVRGFSTLGVDEVQRLTGLPPAAARLAVEREYDEPFLVDAGEPALVALAAERRGLRVTRGGRFHHLTGPTDKGRALVVLLDLLKAAGSALVTAALGDSPNDLSMLSVVDRPVLVPRPGGAVDASLAAALPGALRAPAPGPAGWNAAVLQLLAEEGAP
jgi:mannosyl-3-phosphoglycerate phosphatase